MPIKKSMTISLSVPGPRSINVDLKRITTGVYEGAISCGPLSLRVEAIEADVYAANMDYQNRIDRFTKANEGSLPTLLPGGRKKYYISIEPYALS